MVSSLVSEIIITTDWGVQFFWWGLILCGIFDKNKLNKQVLILNFIFSIYLFTWTSNEDKTFFETEYLESKNKNYKVLHNLENFIFLGKTTFCCFPFLIWRFCKEENKWYSEGAIFGKHSGRGTKISYPNSNNFFLITKSHSVEPYPNGILGPFY